MSDVSIASSSESMIWQVMITDEDRMRLLAEIMAVKVTAGDMITLQGDLGAGKTTFSRFLIRAILGDDAAEVPSPTFTLVQTYETARFDIRHFDLYRLSSAEELLELDFEDDGSAHLTVVEWPDRAGGAIGSCRFDVMIADGVPESETGRVVSISATPPARLRLLRMKAHYEFLVGQFDTAALASVRLSFLQGDASARGYARLTGGDRPALVMDMPQMADGPIIQNGKSYSALAHLAEDARPFVAIATELRACGLSAPEIHAFDAARGIALIEDLGRLTFAEAMSTGVAQSTLWHAAVDVLTVLRQHPPRTRVGAGSGVEHPMPWYDADVMMAEIELLCDWYWPHTKGRAMDAGDRADFLAAWAPLIASVATTADNAETQAWVLRDFHSPNLLWLPERRDRQRVRCDRLSRRTDWPRGLRSGVAVA